MTENTLWMSVLRFGGQMSRGNDRKHVVDGFVNIWWTVSRHDDRKHIVDTE